MSERVELRERLKNAKQHMELGMSGLALRELDLAEAMLDEYWINGPYGDICRCGLSDDESNDKHTASRPPLPLDLMGELRTDGLLP